MSMSEMQGKRGQGSWWFAGLGLLLATSLLLAACGSGSGSGSSSSSSKSASTKTATPATGWSLPGADLQNSRYVGGPINASNVSTLGVAWTVPITATSAFGGYSTTPVVVKGVLYTQDLASNVQAIDLKSGKVLWTH